MDNTTTQPSHLRPFDDIIPLGLIPNDSVRQNVQDKLTQASALDELNKKINEFNVEQDNFAKYKKREIEKLQAKQKVLDEQEARIKRDRNLIDADKKRVNEQSKQVLQDKAKNDARKKELDILKDQIRQNFDESESKLKLIEDNFEKQKFTLNRLLFLEDRTLDNHKNLFDRINDLSQKLADNDVKNDLILEELTKPDTPQVKKQTTRKNTKPASQLSLSLDEKFDDTYIFKDVNGDELGACTNMDSVLHAMKHQLYTTNQPFHNVKFQFFIDNTNYDLCFEELHSSNQQDLMQFIQNPS